MRTGAHLIPSLKVGNANVEHKVLKDAIICVKKEEKKLRLKQIKIIRNKAFV